MKIPFLMNALKRITIIKILTATSIYTVMTVLNQLSSLLLLFVFTRFLEPLHYGILATFQAIYPITQMIIDGGGTFAVSREWLDRDEKGKSDFGLYLLNAFFLKGIVFLGVMVLFIGMKDFLSEIFKIPVWLVLWIPVVSFLSAALDMFFRLWGSQKKSVLWGLVQGGRTIMNVGLALMFVVVFKWGWEGRIVGLILTELFFVILTVLLILREFSLKFDINFKWIKAILVLGCPSLILSINHWVINLSDRLLITNMLDTVQTGIYAVGYSFGSVLELLAGAFSWAFMPFLIEKLKNISESQKNSLVGYSYIYFGILFLITLIWNETAPFFFKWVVGIQYSEAVQFIPWIAFAYFFRAIFRMFSLYIFHSKKIRFLIYPAVGSSIINIILNYFLIQRNGALGAAQATFFAFIFETLMVFFYVKKLYSMPWFTFFKRRGKTEALVEVSVK